MYSQEKVTEILSDKGCVYIDGCTDIEYIIGKDLILYECQVCLQKRVMSIQEFIDDGCLCKRSKMKIL